MSTDSILLPSFYYVGNFDDEIRRYSPGELTLRTINDTLFQAAIAGGPLLINDGYLMHFRDGRLALTDPSASPLTHLLQVGFVKLFSRTGGDLAGMPKKMQHIPTYQKLLLDPEWPELQVKLGTLQSNLGSKAIVDWPRKDIGPGFRRLVRVALKNLRKTGLPSYVNEQDVETLFSTFDRALEEDSRLAARTTWNRLIDELDFQFSLEAKEYLHWIGLEAYHYNLAMVASVAFGGRPADAQHFQQPGVVTRYSSIFGDVRMNVVEEEHGTPSEELPRPWVPKGFYESASTDGKFLVQLVTAGSLLDLKSRYLSSLHRAIEDRHHLQEARNAADEYGRALSVALFQDDQERSNSFKWLSVLLGHGVGYLGARMHDPIGGAMVGAMVGLAAPDIIHAAQSVYHSSIRPPVPLAIHLIKPLEYRRPDFDILSAPIPPAKWSAFMPVDPSYAMSHFASLPTLQ